MSDFKAGDVVRLKSGGPPMTIDNVVNDEFSGDRIASCTWFDGKDIIHDIFNVALLEYRRRP